MESILVAVSSWTKIEEVPGIGSAGQINSFNNHAHKFTFDRSSQTHVYGGIPVTPEGTVGLDMHIGICRGCGLGQGMALKDGVEAVAGPGEAERSVDMRKLVLR